MNRDKRTAIYSRLRELNPRPTTELDYGTPFELLVSVILYFTVVFGTVFGRRRLNDAEVPEIPFVDVAGRSYPETLIRQLRLHEGLDGVLGGGRH